MQGLFKRKDSRFWWIRKTYQGVDISGSTGETERHLAEAVLLKRMEEVRDAKLFGVRASHSFEEAAERFMAEKRDAKSIAQIAYHLDHLMPFLADVPLDKINNSTLDPFREHRLNVDKVRPTTLKRSLEVLRTILNRAATVWFDEIVGKTWLEQAPRIEMPSSRQIKQTSDVPFPLNADQLIALFDALGRRSSFQRDVCTFAYHTGLRGTEATRLSWRWEQQYPDLDRPVFFIPGDSHKNANDRVVILSDTAWRIVERYREQREDDNPWVFPNRRTGNPLYQLHSNQWKAAWREVGLPTEGFVCGPHSLRHTLVNRLQAIGAPQYAIMAFMGHVDKSVTDHYNSVSVGTMIELINKAVAHQSSIIFRSRRETH